MKLFTALEGVPSVIHVWMSQLIGRIVGKRNFQSADNCRFQLKIAKMSSAADTNLIFLWALQHGKREMAKKIQSCPTV